MKTLPLLFAMLLLSACSAGTPVEPANAEIPITSKSPEAIEHFKKGRDLVENVRLVEAAQEFEEALTLDPDFALARAYLGIATPGAEGLNQIERASEQAAGLPLPERLSIEATLATARGEFAKGTELWKQLANEVPGDWRAQLGLGTQLYIFQKYGDAAAALKKASELNPSAGPVYNSLGYAYLFQGEVGAAIEAFKQYANLNPAEPNPHDSLAEALMAGGQFAEAETEFRKAADLSPTLSFPWEGVAYTKFFAGDWVAGRDALRNAHESASRTADRITVETLAALSALAEGRLADGLAQLDAIEESPDVPSQTVAFVAIHRALALVDASRYTDALTQTAKAIQLAESGQLPPGVTITVRFSALAVRAATEGRMGDAAAVEKTVAALEQEAIAQPDDLQLQSALHFARGMLAIARKDSNTGRTHFDQCSDRDFTCLWQSFVVSHRSGDEAGAAAARARIVKSYVRDPVYLYARASLNRMAPEKS